MRSAQLRLRRPKKMQQEKKKKRFAKGYKKKYGCESPQLTEQETEASVDAEIVVQENGDLFHLDPTPMF